MSAFRRVASVWLKYAAAGLLLLLGAPSCDLNPDPGTGPDPYTPCAGLGSVEFTALPDGELSGEVPVSLSITAEAPAPALLYLTATKDGGETWRPAMVKLSDGEYPEERGRIDGLSSAPGPAGEAVELTWNTEALGAGRFEDVLLKAVVFTTCDGVPGLPLPLRISAPVTVDNAPRDCSVRIESPVSGVELSGDIRIDFTLSHPLGEDRCVEAAWSTVRHDRQTIEPYDRVDCDLDGGPDTLDRLDSSPAGTPHCLVWDSDGELNEDTLVSLELACGPCRPTGGVDAVEHSAWLKGLSLANDPTPEPDELIISEVLPRSSYPGGAYFEVRNLANRVLDLSGLEVKRWDQGADPAVDDPDDSFFIVTTAGPRPVQPGERILIAGTTRRSDNGCLEPQVTWDGTGFALLDRSILALARGRTEVTVLDFSDPALWSFATDISLGLDPASANPADAALRANWCAQTSPVPGCASVPNPGVVGTPGSTNDPCD